MRSPRQQQHNQRLTEASPARVEPLEGRRLLSATSTDLATDASALATGARAATKAERLVPNPRAAVLVDGRPYQNGRVLNLGTFAQGAPMVTRTGIEIQAVVLTLPFAPGGPVVSAPEHFEATTADPTGKFKNYNVTITFDPSEPGTFSGPIIFKTNDQGSIFLNVTATVLPTPVGRVAQLDVLQPPQRTGAVSAKPGTVSVVFTNPGAATLAGKTDVQVFASKDLVLDDADVLVGNQKVGLSMPKGAARVARVHVRYPATLPTGDYFLIAKATGAPVIDPAQSTAANPVPQHVTAPTINLRGVPTTGPAFTTATRHSRVAIPVQNLGTVNARGTRIDVDLFVSPTASIDPATLVPLTSYRNLPVTPRAQSQAYQAVTPRLPQSLPPGFTGDTFYIVARITRFTLPKTLSDLNVSPTPSDYFLVR